MASILKPAAGATALPPAIGRFRPSRVLGRGGQGTVYLAHDPDLGRDVAVKTLTHRSRDAAKLANEARNCARLEHPNIVALFEVGLDQATPYLVYQFAKGQPLTFWTSGQQLLPVNRALLIMTRILDAMQYAHERGVLHRDLTPANILVDDNDQPHILDFGISVAISDTGGAHTMAGTANYMAPEVLANQPPSAASDLFALGVVLYELLTGEPLFAADNTMAVIYKVVNERIAPPSMKRAGLDATLDGILMKSLERDPSRRYAGAGAMRDDLTAYLKPRTATEVNESPRAHAKDAIAFLQRRMARRPDFPAVSAHIAEISQKSGDHDRVHINDMASVILKDYALTAKLLKVVNSAVYAQYGGTISTVSRALVILGYEQVRALALGLVIFEHLKNGEQAAALKDAVCSSFLSSMLARELCQTEGRPSYAEEAFIGAMFHKLGRHLAIYYFPEEYGEIVALMEAKGIEESVAAREILGAEFADFGIAIGRDWNLPDSLTNAMRPMRQARIKGGATSDEVIAQLSVFSNDVADVVATAGPELDSRLDALRARYEECFKLSTPALKKAVANAVDATRSYAELISLDVHSTPFLGKVKRAVTDDAGSLDNMTGALAAGRGRAPSDAAIETEVARTERRHLFLTNAISELTTAILERAPINAMFTMVLEALYRSMGFTHVLFMMRDPKRRTYTTRFGFGEAVDTLKGHFEYTISTTDDIFSQAVSKGRNAVIIDTNDARYCDSIPDWCRTQLQPQSILVFAVVVNKVCIGLIYADACHEPLRISATELKLLNTLVKQLTLGVHTR